MNTPCSNAIAEMYSDLCDYLCREFFGEQLGTHPADGRRHTSSEARRIATELFALLNVASA